MANCMSTPVKSNIDFEGAKKEVWEQLSELNPHLYYHGRHHTFDDVLPRAEILAAEEGLDPTDTLIVKTAALFHDTGFLDQYDKNEPFGCERARRALPKYGYSQELIDRICDCIMATQLPQNPKDILGQIVCDADLGHLGTEFYFMRSECLRMELIKIKGKSEGLSVVNWHKGNVGFLKNHNYFSASATKTLGPVKEANLLETMLLVNHDKSEAKN